MTRIDLVTPTPTHDWPLGSVYTTLPAQLNADAYLYWQAPQPPHPPTIRALYEGSPHHPVCISGPPPPEKTPTPLDILSPVWMLNDTSWYIGLNAALIDSTIIQHIGPPTDDLTFAYRALMAGVITQHSEALPAQRPPQPDWLEFTAHTFGRKWMLWVWVRSLLNGRLRRPSWAKAKGYPALPPKPLAPPPPLSVSVVIPTLGRREYLLPLLTQLNEQAPHQIIVIDQSHISPPEGFDHVTWLHQSEAGQCTARNTGIQNTTGDVILFLDDDIEIPPDLIKSHLATLHTYQADASCGAVHERGAETKPPTYDRPRRSDVFPTTNTAIRRTALTTRFDQAFDRLHMADGEFGLRLHRAGHLLIYNPQISVIHYHAPTGGLRHHKQRAITYASSRSHLFQRNLPDVGEIYYARRHFNPAALHEMLWLRVVGTFITRGSWPKRIAKALIALMLLPHTLFIIARNKRRAQDLQPHIE